MAIIFIVMGVVLMVFYSRCRFYRKLKPRISYLQWLMEQGCEGLLYWSGIAFIVGGFAYIAFSSNSLESWLALLVLIIIGKAADTPRKPNQP
jgi:hypothetical protein